MRFLKTDMMNYLTKTTSVLGLLILFNCVTSAQDEKTILKELAVESQEAIDALVLYPKETRLTILEAALYPEALIKLESIQSKSKRSFEEIIGGLPLEEQKAIWGLTRYPNLINRLSTIESSAAKHLDNVLMEYPELIHQRAKTVFHENFSKLQEISSLSEDVDTAYKSVLSKYDIQTQEAFNDLVELPEVLGILTDNIRLSILIGEVYKEDSEWLINKTDSLNLVVVRQNAKELEDWQSGLEKNPEVLAEFKESVTEYTEENSYDDDYYNYEEDIFSEENRVEYVTHYNYHYSYWYSYPSWYTYPRWRYYPYYMNWGYYHIVGHPVVFIGLPSFHFTNWYFLKTHHHTYWPQLSTHFVYYARRSNSSRTSISNSVEKWRKSNAEIIDENWLKNDGHLRDRFREFGKLEVARENYNIKHPDAPMTKKQYVSSNSREYPQTSKVINQKENKNNVNTERKKVVLSNKKKETKREEQKTDIKPYDSKRKSNREVYKKQTPTKVDPHTKKGAEYHKNKWDSPRRTVKPNNSPKKYSTSKSNRSDPAKAKTKFKKKPSKTKRRSN